MSMRELASSRFSGDSLPLLAHPQRRRLIPPCGPPTAFGLKPADTRHYEPLLNFCSGRPARSSGSRPHGTSPTRGKAITMSGILRCSDVPAPRERGPKDCTGAVLMRPSTAASPRPPPGSIRRLPIHRSGQRTDQAGLNKKRLARCKARRRFSGRWGAAGAMMECRPYRPAPGSLTRCGKIGF